MSNILSLIITGALFVAGLVTLILGVPREENLADALSVKALKEVGVERRR